MAQSRLFQEIFISSGNWVCPAGVTNIWIIATGGGGGGGAGAGGGGGSTAAGARGGGAGGTGGSSQIIPVLLSVIPGTSYPITIGAGGSAVGSGGAGGTSCCCRIIWRSWFKWK